MQKKKKKKKNFKWKNVLEKEGCIKLPELPRNHISGGGGEQPEHESLLAAARRD